MLDPTRSCALFNPASAFLHCPLAARPRAANSALILLTCSGYSFCTRSRYSCLSFKSRAASHFLIVYSRLWVRNEYQHDTRETQSEPTAKTTAKFSRILFLLFLHNPQSLLSPLLPSAKELPRFCRKVASNTLLSTICGVFHVLSFQYVVWFVNFATERAACNGSTPTGASPVTVFPQGGCVVIPDSGCG